MKVKYIPEEQHRVSEEFYIKFTSTQEKIGLVKNSLNLLKSIEIIWDLKTTIVLIKIMPYWEIIVMRYSTVKRLSELEKNDG